MGSVARKVADTAGDSVEQPGAGLPPAALLFGIGYRHRGDEPLGVLGLRVTQDLIPRAHLLQHAVAQHRDVVGQPVDHGQVVADEQAGERPFPLQLLEQVEHRRLHRHVERAGGLVGDQQVGAQRQRPCQVRALPLAAGQLVRVARGGVLGSRTASSSSATRAVHSAPRITLCTFSGSATQSPTRSRGFSEVAGSWNTKPNFARTGRSCFWVMAVMSWPRILTVPVVGFCSAATQRPIVDLPEPDSPTRPRVLPRSMLNVTSSTALNAAEPIAPGTRH